MLPLRHTIAAGHGELTDDARIVQCGTASNFVSATRSCDSHGTTRFATEYGRQIALPTLGSKTIQHGTQELHQCRFASFVRAIEDRHPFGQRIDGKPRPDTKAVDLYIANLHLLDSSKASRGCEKIELMTSQHVDT